MAQIGSGPDQIPTNALLGKNAFVDNAIIIAETQAPTEPGRVVFELESDTSLLVKVKGADGVVRTATIALT